MVLICVECDLSTFLCDNGVGLIGFRSDNVIINEE